MIPYPYRPLVGQESPDYCGTTVITNPRFRDILVAINYLEILRNTRYCSIEQYMRFLRLTTKL